MKRFSMRPAAVFAAFALAAAAAAPAFGWEWEWNWRMPGDIYKGLEFESRNAVDRAYKATSAAMDAERTGARPTDLVPRFRAAAAEWRKVEIQAESDNTSDALLAYAGIYDKAGKPFMVVTIGEDISSAYEREREVVHYKNFLQEIVNNLPV
ncbi:MAG: hypothetical protein IJ983_03580, partial [Kiritimatiellae bacterium]|nr:hypothetical protein [Kiritimatiellia bacterium]